MLRNVDTACDVTDEERSRKGMMGAEPLEVPQQTTTTTSEHQQNYQQTSQSLIIPPTTGLEDGCWDQQHNTRSTSQSNGGGQSASNNNNNNNNSKGPRRTRHRVDAGEPRGCFNSANNPNFAFQPRNIFTSPNHPSHNHSNNNNSSSSVRSPLVANSTNSLLSSPYHLHHPHSHHNLAGFANPLQISHNFYPQAQPQERGQQGQDAYYFQPMKMLSEFITSQQAAAAAAAAAAATASSTTSTNSHSPTGGVNGQTAHHQLLLREMLSKSRNNSSSVNNNNNNNNNNVTKCGYEEDVVMEHEKSSTTPTPGEVSSSGAGSKEDLSTTEIITGGGSSGGGGADDSEEEESMGMKLVKVETSSENKGVVVGGQSNGHLNANSTSSSVTSNCSTGNSGMRINGCKKRKLYQPQQRSDFEEVDEEEEVDDEDYDSNVLVEAAAMARSGRLNNNNNNNNIKDCSPPPTRSSPLAPPTVQLLPHEEEEEDEEEEMQRMLIKTDHTDYDDDQFDDDDDEDEILTSNNNNNNNKEDNLRVHSSSAAAAPLTRQLLTERNVGKELKPTSNSNSLSLLRTSTSSPKIMMNSGLNHMNMRRREHHHQQPQDEHHFIHQQNSALPIGVPNNPAAYFYQWKENFKSTLITHITDLVDSQFSLLFPAGQGGNPTNNNNNNNNTNNNNNSSNNNNNSGNNNRTSTPASTPIQNQHHHHQRDSPLRNAEKASREIMEKTPLQQKNQTSLLLNGGTVCNNNNRDMCSPPPEKIPRLELQQRGNNNKNDFFPRFPFQVSGNIPRGEPQQQQVKSHQQQQQQNFSSALMGLSQAAQLQHHHQAAAAAAAALNAAEMFDNDGPLSLVVSRQHDQMTPRKKRHKVTDTRLTPRAVSRLLGQVDNYGGDLSGGSPSRGDAPRTPPPSNVPSLPTSVAISNPSLSDSARLFTPYAHPLFHHGPGGNHHRLGSSPPMGASMIHPALLANPAEYVQQLRAEMNEQRNGDLIRENSRGDHVRAVRDSGSSLLSSSIGGGVGGGPGSAGSDSGETNSYGGDLPGSLYSCGTSHSSSTLTPMHLRKAKLMFFWVRYPSSSVIKMYFPDIKFNKNNTAQLVKWFSNFREFYYIQMEKYARQALSEGIKNAEELHVTIDNELYRVLNLHYNRNNHIEVPTNFRFVVEQTLREFFKAIQQGKDQEQSWKKAIYKIIARLDDPVPEYFKSPNFLEQLE